MVTPNFRQEFSRPTDALRPNRFESTCTQCGKRVKVGEGYLYGQTGAWSVKHANCEENQKQAQETVLADGFYTVIHADGSYRTLRVRTQDEDSDFMPGKQILGYLSGSDNENNYTNFGHLAQTKDGYIVRSWRRFADRTDLMGDAMVLINDPSAARESYAEQSGRCSRCNRTLTVPSSLHAGLGPECAKKVQ